MELLLDYQILINLISLTALEIILGVDNVIFIALVVAHLPEKQKESARIIGLLIALFMLIALLFAVVWIMGLKKPWLNLFGIEFSGKDLMMLGGGLFIIAKATLEMHSEVAGEDEKLSAENFKGAFTMTVVQIILIDFIFSFDSVITAVGLTEVVMVIVVAMTITMLVMIFMSKYISDFIEKNQVFKILALSFIMMIGVLLVGEGIGLHIPKGYIYFAMLFSLLIEVVNMKISKRKKLKV